MGRRSGLAPSITQGHGTKTGSSIFGMPTQQVRRAASSSAYGRMGGAACAQDYSGGRGLALGQSPDHLSGNSKIQKKKSTARLIWRYVQSGRQQEGKDPSTGVYKAIRQDKATRA